MADAAIRLSGQCSVTWRCEHLRSRVSGEVFTHSEVSQDYHEGEEELQPQHRLPQPQVPDIVATKQAEHHRGASDGSPALGQEVT